MSTQLNLPFGLSAGCTFYVDEFLIKIGVQKPDKPEEICQGGLVFPVGQKEDCVKCASTCQGCVEMAINLGFIDYEEVGHLVEHPEMLSSKYKKLFYSNNSKK